MSRNRPPAALFVCKKRTYTNTLTTSDVACPPKFANLWFHTVERYGECRPNSLTAETKFEVWPEDILTNCPSLIDLSIYERGPDGPINEKDAILMEDDSAPNPNTKRSQQHSKIVPWMRKTEYISTEFSRFGVSSDRSENKIGYSIKKRYGNQENFYKDEASQIEAIKKIFEDTKKPVRRHHSKKNVVAVEEISILPDADQWKFEYAQMNFDNEPVPPPEAPNQQQYVIMKGMADTEGRQFVGYFVPTPETYKQLEEDKAEGRTHTEGFDYKYTCARNYDWQVQTKNQRGINLQTYFFTQRNGVFYYCDVESRVKLTRRAKQTAADRNMRLNVRNRENTEEEQAAMTARQNALYDPYITGTFLPLHEEEEEEEVGEEVKMEADDASPKKDPEEANAENSPKTEASTEESSSSGESGSGSSSSDSDEEAGEKSD